MPREIDFEQLRMRADALAARAYAPYSKFLVGAAGLVADGRSVGGCNVENASYPVGLCAECGLVSELVATGGGQLVAVSCRTGAGQTVLPCGRCRQLLFEHGGGEVLIDTCEGPRPLAELLPAAFGPADLKQTNPDLVNADLHNPNQPISGEVEES
jgi:cytidine deaminase